ncbi:MAG: BTAD domain-containing putative transcriptional regulator [Chloroflexota bacterium]
MSLPPLNISIFGTFLVHIDNVKIDSFSTAKARALLAYLAVEGKHPIARSQLAELFWPDRLEESARGSLRHALSNLRKVLGEQDSELSYLLTNRRTVQLNPDALETGIIAIDVDRFQTLYQQASSSPEAAHQAIALYQGPFFDSNLFIDSPEFDKWIQLQREVYHRQMAGLLTRVSQQMMDVGEHSAAVTYAQKLVDHEPWHEEAHVQLMNALWRNGQADAAMRQYLQCQRWLREELDVDPSPETAALYETIRDNRHQFPGATAKAIFGTNVLDERPLESSQPTSLHLLASHNIPPQLKSFFGRERELAEMSKRIAHPNCRQLTVIGPGGMGKTQLVLEYARQQISHFADGVWFVPLAGLENGAQIPSTIANALGIPMTAEQDPMTRLGQYLHDRTLLLILDNFEHLQESALLIPQLLRHATQITILVTSRERLNLQAETVFVLGGLDLPSLDTLEKRAGVPPTESGAVALFIDCAQRADISFELTEESRAAVVQICRLIDGMPLGIELAAVWTRLLSCQEILDSLRRNIDLLTVTMPDVPARHRCIRALFEESWQNLSPDAQQVFAQASVFRGQFDWSALQQVTNGTMPQVIELIDRSFLRKLSGGTYQIHELMRQFGAEKLTHLSLAESQVDLPEGAPTERAPKPSSIVSEAEVARRHAFYYLGFLEMTAAELLGSTQVHAMQKISQALENIRGAWQWALEKRHQELLSMAGEGLFKYYDIRGLAHEGEAIFGATVTQLALDKELPTELLVRMRNHLGAFLEPLGRGDDCRALLVQNLAVARENNLIDAVGWALLRLGMLDMWHQADSARSMLEESRDCFRQTNNSEGIIAALGHLSYIHVRQVDLNQALLLAEEALQLARALEAPLLIATTLARLSSICTNQSQYEMARSYAEEALGLARLLNNSLLEGELLNNLAAIATYEGDNERSLLLLEESIQLFQKVGLESGDALSAQENMGRLALRMADWEKALFHLQETAAKSRRANNDFMLARCQEGMALAFVRLGDYKKVRPALRSAIEMKDLWQSVDAQSSILETMVLLLIGEESYKDAAELLAYKTHHYLPRTYSMFDDSDARTALQNLLGNERYQEIQSTAPQQDLKEMIGAIL